MQVGGERLEKSVGQQNKSKTCANCGHENLPGALECAECHAPLPAIETVQVPDEILLLPSATTKVEVELPPFLKGHTLALYIAGEAQPIIIKDKEEIVLGRSIPDETGPTVDLTRFNAHVMGVSRRHAAIRTDHETRTIIDLESSNGTWVNENRLTPSQPHPLKNGDQIRLGQLICFVYFISVDSITLIDQSKPSASIVHNKFTTADLLESIAPYLKALAELQSAINTVLGRDPFEMGLKRIAASTGNALSVDLDGAGDAVEWVKKLPPWKAAHQGAPISEEALSQLAAEWVNQLAPNLSEESKLAHRQQLIGPLRVLVESSLNISPES
jgi:hypothetical protein